MTPWPDDNGDEAYEFYDPSDSGAFADPTGPPVDSSASADEHIDSDVPDGMADGAVSDPTGAVHVWFDDQHRVTRVRVSNRWRERLRKEKKELAEVLVELLRMQQTRPAAPLPEPEVSSTTTTERLNDVTLDRLMERSKELDRLGDALRARTDVRRTRLVGERVTGSSSNRMVQVMIDPRAHTGEIHLDRAWLDHATAATLGEAITQAHLDAYGRWTPPQTEFGEWDLLNVERRAVTAELAALMNNGL